MASDLSDIEYQSRINEIQDLGRKAVDHGTKLGASQIEVEIRNGLTRSIEIKANGITGIQQQSNSGIDVRVYLGKQLGLASGTMLSDASIEEVVTDAYKLAKLAPSDDGFESLPSPTTTPFNVQGLYDTNISNVDPAVLVEFAKDLIQGGSEVREAAVMSGRIQATTSERSVVNSLGIEGKSETTAFTGFAFASIPMEPTNVGVGFEMLMGRSFDNPDFTELGKISTEKAEKMLNAQIAPSKKLPILFSHRGAYQSLQAIIGMGVNGYQVMTKTSYFADKVGAEVAVAELHAFDDPHVSGGMSSIMIDSEGTPTTKVNLIENGVLKSYVTDSYTANKLGLENTGNANRNQFTKVPRPSMRQLQVQGGSGSAVESLLEDMKEGIYMESGVNPAGGSPNISSQINRGFYVMDGEIQYPLKNTMLGSDVFDFLNGITVITKDVLVEFGHQSPAFMIKEASIAGAGDKKSQSAPTSMGPM